MKTTKQHVIKFYFELKAMPENPKKNVYYNSTGLSPASSSFTRRKLKACKYLCVCIHRMHKYKALENCKNKKK
jgi:hypothetical protein